MQHAARSLWLTLLIVIVSAVSMVMIILLFGGKLLKPALEHYVSYKSHRIVKADEMQLEFSRSLRPTIKFRNLYIQNAPWSSQMQSSQRPLVSAREISFSFASFRWPFSATPGIVEISMSDGEVNLERMQDGLRNWRLLKPEYRGPGRYLVMALEANRSIVRFTDHSTGLNLVAQSSTMRTAPLSSKAVISSAPEPYANQITFTGTYHDQEFIGEASTGQRLTFQKTGETFPIHGIAHSGKMELRINGKVGDIFKNQIVDADIHFSTPSASALNAVMNTHLPNTRPINASSHIVKISNEYHVNDLQGTLGHTDIAGNLTYIYNKIDDKNPSSLKGSLASNETQLNDLLPIKPEPEKTLAAGSPFIARNSISPEMLKSQDLDLSFTVHKLISPALPPIENLYMKVDLNNGNLKISPIHATVSDSTVKAEFSLNAQTQPMAAHILLDAPNLAMNELLSKTKLHDMVAAPLTAHININGIGDSPPAILGSTSGTMDFAVGHGEISNKLDAKMGLDMGKLVWLSISGDKKIAVDHGAIHLVFKNGMGQSRDTAIETSQTIVQGKGSIDLRNQTLDFLLTPKPKDPTLFSLKSNIHIHGPLSEPGYQLEHRLPATNPTRS